MTLAPLFAEHLQEGYFVPKIPYWDFYEKFGERLFIL